MTVQSYGLIPLTDRNCEVSNQSTGYVYFGKSNVVKTWQHASRRTSPHVFLPPTPFEAFRREYHNGIIAFADPAYIHCIEYTSGTPYLALEGIDSDAENRLQNIAIMRALSQLKDQKVNYAQAFAERAQTARLVGDSALKIGKSLLALKHKDWKGAANALGLSTKLFKHGKGTHGSIGDNWLELQYGWKPLLSDVYGSVAELARKDDETKDRYRVTVRGSFHEDQDILLNRAVGQQKGDRYHVTVHKSTRVRLDYNYVNPVTGTLARLGITDPLTLAWELTPYSFVADWFAPIGGYISSLSAANGYAFLGGSSTYHQTCICQMLDYGPGGFADRYNFPSRLGYTSGKEVRRKVFEHSPLPSYPGFKNPFSLVHMANALALLTGSVKVR